MDKPIYKNLYVQVLFAIAFGIAIGYWDPGFGIKMEPLSVGFVKLIKMIVAPIIFCTIVTGIANMESMKSVGKIGGLAILYFEIITTIALIIGLVVVNVVAPGTNNSYVPSGDEITDAANRAKGGAQKSGADFLLNVIPKTFVDAFAGGDILQVLLLALLFGFALHAVGEPGRPIREFIDKLSNVFFGVIAIVVKLAPIGAFGAMAFAIGKYGMGMLWSLGKLMLCFYATCLMFVFVVLGGIARANGFKILRFVKYIREELLIVLGTSSSESVLPRLMKKMESVGCGSSVVRLVVPTGYSFNLDGTSIYLTMAAVFIAQATNTPFPLADQLGLLLVALLTSKGAAAVTGGGLVVLAATLSSFHGIPIAGLALVLGVDRFMSEARALTNLVGNGVATVVVSKWCKQLDEKQMRAHLG